MQSQVPLQQVRLHMWPLLPAAQPGRPCTCARLFPAAQPLACAEAGCAPAGREGNVYGAASGRKKQKLGGSSNRQKSKQKALPKAAFVAAQGHRRKAAARHNVKGNFKGRRPRTRK